MSSEIIANEARSSAFQTLHPISESVRLTRSLEGDSTKSASKISLLSMNSGSASNTNSNYGSNSSSSNGNGNGNSPKMGSRRIFTPQFKLQVLESYRSDSDCKGNQRATARKYNIHRRQIQKWLQCESNLRSSVANINQNNVKHQFHNVSHNQPQQVAQVSRLQLTHTNPSASRNGATNGFGQHNHPHHHTPSLALSSLNVPSLPSCLDATGPASAQGVLAAANLAAAVAVAIASTSAPSNSTMATSISPIRPKAVNGTNGGVSNGVSNISPSFLHSHHHQHHSHFPISPYSSASAGGSIPVAMPLIPHHLGTTSQQPNSIHQHYSYHGMPTHAQSHSLRFSHQPSAFLPTALLPVNVLSAMPASKADEENNSTAEYCKDNKAADKLKITTPSATTTVTAMHVVPTIAGFAENIHAHLHESNDRDYIYHKATHVDRNCERGTKFDNYFTHSAYPSPEKGCTMTIPMDLSLGRKRRDSNETEERNENPTRSSNITKIVDLTFRKRKVVTASAFAVDATHPQKLAKHLEESSSIASFGEILNSDSTTEKRNNDDEDEEIEVEVDADAKQMSSKPVKLFKPYLLDKDDECDQSSTGKAKPPNTEIAMGDQREPIIWINHPAYDSSRASSIYSPPADKQTFHGGSPYFLESKPPSPQHVLSPMSAASLSPSNFLRCPKGSPVSGYESSSSICSERDDSCSLNECRSYSLDFQMHAALENQLTSQPLQIRKWLDQDLSIETNTPPLKRASITLYA